MSSKSFQAPDIGKIILVNWDGTAGVFDQATGERVGIVSEKRFVEYPVGIYRIRFSKFEIEDVEVVAGEEIIVKVDR